MKRRPVDTWPPAFIELRKVYHSLCNICTFLSARGHFVPSIDKILPTVKKELGREVELVELCKIKCLLPDDIHFDYIDINQTVKDSKDVYQLQDDEQHILVFEFVDGKLKPDKMPENQHRDIRDMPTPTFSVVEMRKFILKRRSKFEDAVDQFLMSYEEDAADKLEQLSKDCIPIRPTFVDPLDRMARALNGDRNMDISQIIESVKSDEEYHGQIVENGELEFEAREPRFGDLQVPLSDPVAKAIYTTRGIQRFYSHQADAINAIKNREHVIVATSTSSGKSLIYQLPVLELLVNDPDATAIYIFPTKALAQDQRKAFEEMVAEVAPDVHVDTYDGDTPAKLRAEIRNTARVIFTNPDMLHASILPSWRSWSTFLRNLKIVVVDELHVYNGLFGSHVAMVMRRLRRVCERCLGNESVQFVSCSATVHNPREMMKRLFGVEQVTLVDQDGSPCGKKHMILWNTPYVSPNDANSGRVNPMVEAAKLFERLIENGVRTIAFCRVRRVCELLIKIIRQRLGEDSPLVNRVMSYRGGYSAQDRRKIEQEMFSGGLLGIVATNALELGIDIGNLDAVIIVGFPFTISNLRQQIGRAGRRNKDSLAVLVGGGGAVDQHYLQNPQQIIRAENPAIVLELDNPLVVEMHLQCAAFEAPLEVDHDTHYFPTLPSLADRLSRDENNLLHTNERFLPWPSKSVGLRGGEEDQFAVVDTTNDRNIVIEQIEGSRTPFTLYEGGIFLHQGYPYLIKEFRPSQKLAKVIRVNVDWITRQRDFTDVDPVETEQKLLLQDSGLHVYFGKVRHTSVVFGFFKIDKRERVLDAVEVDNPPYVFDSKGFWLDVPSETLQLLRDHKLSLAGGIHGAEHALMNLMPQFVSALPNEVGTECKAKEKEFASKQSKRVRPARLVFYDRTKGGCGITAKAFEFVDEMVQNAIDRIDACDCALGCPACVASETCKEDSVVVSKVAARVILGVFAKRPLDNIPMGPEPNLRDCTTVTVTEATHVRAAIEEAV